MTSPEAAPAPSTPAGPRGRRTAGEFDRRTLIISALVLFGAIAAGILAIAVFSDPGEPTARLPNEQVQPQALVRPNQGSKPENAGDRGGWEQLAILALIIGAIVAIAFVVFRGGSKARANRERWKAAGASGHDGAIGP